MEQVKVTIPVVLNVLSKVSVLNLEEEHNRSITELFEAAVRIGGSIQEMCKNMVCNILVLEKSLMMAV